jgi:hypothetical protein
MEDVSSYKNACNETLVLLLKYIMFSILHTKIYHVQRTTHENISCSAYYTPQYITFSVLYTKTYPVQRTIQENIICLSDICVHYFLKE